MKKAGRALAACALHVLAACTEGDEVKTSLSDSPAPATTRIDESPRETPRLLCASCDPHDMAGGETGDFIGESTGCDVTVRDVARDFEGFGLSAAAAIQLVERSASAPGRFRPSRNTWLWVHADEVSGYTPNPTVDVALEVTAVQLIEESGLALVPDVECTARMLRLETRAHVSTSDGALSGTFEAGWATVEVSSEATLFAVNDAAGFTGSLDFGSSNEPPVTQLEASLYLYLTPESMRGTLELSVFTDGMAYGALALDWPASDTCEPSDTPVTADEYLPVLAAAQQTLEQLHPTTAHWASPEAFRGTPPADEPASEPPAGTATEVTVALNGPISAVCRAELGNPVSPMNSYSFQTAAQVSTSDGRVSATLSGFLGVVIDQSGAVADYGFFAAQRFRTAELESTWGIHGANLMGSDCGVLFFRDSLGVPNQEARGQLEIDTQPCGDEYEPSRLVDFLSWCSGPCTYPEAPIFTR